MCLWLMTSTDMIPCLLWVFLSSQNRSTKSYIQFHHVSWNVHSSHHTANQNYK